eukprot:1899512-Alexandrium_andersonii.AAC.1
MCIRDSFSQGDVDRVGNLRTSGLCAEPRNRVTRVADLLPSHPGCEWVETRARCGAVRCGAVRCGAVRC